MLVSLDIETKCTVPGCKDRACNHALNPFTSEITCVGIYYEEKGKEYGFVYRDLDELNNHLQSLRDVRFIGQNFKFDLKHLHFHGLSLSIKDWAHDTQLMASVSMTKVTPEYLAWYEMQRKEENKKLPRGFSHRIMRKHSLKVLAPFFLEVVPFWEDPSNHDNDEYVLKDCKYTYKLYEFFRKIMETEETYEFYEKLLDYSKMLFRAELRGIKINLKMLDESFIFAKTCMKGYKEALDNKWEEVYNEYYNKKSLELALYYQEKEKKALIKAKNKLKCIQRYQDLYIRALRKLPDKMNLDSPKQLCWIFKDYLKHDIKDFTNKESTAKAVLQRLASEGSQDASLFLEYRKWNKLVTSFYPSYRELNKDGIIHCNFNPTGTRTGRLSSSMPNLQQVPGDLHSLFIARPGYKLASFDMRSIEAVLIAYYSKDPILLDLVIRNVKIHGHNAKIYFPEITCGANEVKDKYPAEYAFAKRLGYALFYGAGAGRIKATATEMGYNWPKRKCREVLENFKEMYRQVFEYKKDVDRRAISEPIENLLGRKHSYLDPTEIYMKAFNTLIQSSASDMVVDSAYVIEKSFKQMQLDAHILLLVHDEIVTEIPENKEDICVDIIKKAMVSYRLDSPQGRIYLAVDGKVSDRWEK